MDILKVGRSSILKHAQEKALRDINKGRWYVLPGVLRAGIAPRPIH